MLVASEFSSLPICWQTHPRWKEMQREKSEYEESLWEHTVEASLGWSGCHEVKLVLGPGLRPGSESFQAWSGGGLPPPRKSCSTSCSQLTGSQPVLALGPDAPPDSGRGLERGRCSLGMCGRTREMCLVQEVSLGRMLVFAAISGGGRQSETLTGGSGCH